MRGAICAAALLALACTAGAQQAPRGKAVYDKWCAGCHGDTGAGDGDGATYMLPRPRDFTKGVYKIRTTASGEIPTDADLRRIVDEGMPGSAMPEWKSRLTEQERGDVVAYIKSFSTFFKSAAKPIDFGKAPSGGEDAIKDGRATFQKVECFKCHGEMGRGDGKSAPTLKDDYGRPIRAADLTESWKFRGGNTVEQIYARLRTGLDGTPMPSFTDAVESKLITEQNLWHVAQYIRSLSPEEPPQAHEVIRAALASGALPTSPADSAWGQAEKFWVPLVGQIIAKPRWFAPTVDGVWVQALHDGKRLALKLTWDDPSHSPDPVWQEWLGRIAQTMTGGDAPVDSAQGADRFAVQFPQKFTDDVERPYFLGGSTRRPAHRWRWTSTPDTVHVETTSGLDQFLPSKGGTEVTHVARYDRGQWQLQFTRPLVPRDTSDAPVFVTGRALPVAFFAADGSNGESGTRGSVSAWYAVYLDTPTPPRVYVTPVITMFLTAGVGSLLVMRAQRRGRGSPKTDTEQR